MEQTSAGNHAAKVSFIKSTAPNSMLSPRCERVAVGGRWRALEEANESLATDLQAQVHELSLVTDAASSATARAQAAEEISETLRAELRVAVNEEAELRSSLAFARQSLVEASEGGAAAAALAASNGAVRDKVISELQACGSNLESTRSEATRLRCNLATSQGLASHENARNTQLEAHSEKLKAELSVSEARLTNRGTHVDLLLRDKERLSAQLSRARQKGEGRTAAECSASAHKQSTAEKPGALKKQPSSNAGNTRTASCGGNQTSVSSSPAQRPSRPVARGRIGYATSGGDACTADLERKIWHLQKALERERSAHEETRECALRLRGASLTVEGCTLETPEKAQRPAADERGFATPSKATKPLTLGYPSIG